MTSPVSSISHNQVTPFSKIWLMLVLAAPTICTLHIIQGADSWWVPLWLLAARYFHRRRLLPRPVSLHATLPIYRLRSRLLSHHCVLRKYYRHHQCSAEQTNNESKLGSARALSGPAFMLSTSLPFATAAMAFAAFVLFPRTIRYGILVYSAVTKRGKWGDYRGTYTIFSVVGGVL